MFGINHYQSFSSNNSTTLRIKSGMNTRGAPRNSSPPDGSEKENGASSHFRFSPTAFLEAWRILSSHAREMFDAFSHLGRQLHHIQDSKGMTAMLYTFEVFVSCSRVLQGLL